MSEKKHIPTVMPEQASLARQDLWHTRLAVAGTCGDYYDYNGVD